MNEAGYLDFFESEASLPDICRYAQALKSEMLAGKSTPDKDTIEEYITVRDVFFGSCADLTGGSTEEAILAEIDRITGRS